MARYIKLVYIGQPISSTCALLYMDRPSFLGSGNFLPSASSNPGLVCYSSLLYMLSFRGSCLPSFSVLSRTIHVAELFPAFHSSWGLYVFEELADRNKRFTSPPGIRRAPDVIDALVSANEPRQNSKCMPGKGGCGASRLRR